MRKILLIILTVIFFLYSFRLGYIWTTYAHGGQLLGVPYAVLMLILTLLFIISNKKSRKEKLFNLSISFAAAIFCFSTTVELIRRYHSEYFSFLYYEPEGWVNEILLGYLTLGAILFIVLQFINGRSKTNKS